MTEKTLVTWHQSTVKRERGCVVWFTGLSGSGKSTVANCVDALLQEANVNSFVLDGDNIRHGLNASFEILEPVHGRGVRQAFWVGLWASRSRREYSTDRLRCRDFLFGRYDRADGFC